MTAWWNPTRLTGRDEVSPWVGIALGGLYLLTVAALGWASLSVHESELGQARLDEARRWTCWLGRHLARVQAAGVAELQREVRLAAREPGISFCEVVSADRTILASSDPSRLGRSAVGLPEPSPDDGADAGVRILRLPEDPGRIVLVAQAVSPAAGGEPLEVRVGLAPPRTHWSQSRILLWAGGVLLTVMILFLLIHRLFRRSVRSLAVIRSRLADCEGSLADRLAALRLNDSCDEVARAWNRLIEFVGQMQEELRRLQLATHVNAAMDRFRSERLSDLLMQIPLGVMVVDENRRVAFANRAAGGMLGINHETVEGQPVGEFLDEKLQVSLLAPPKSLRGPTTSGRWIDHTFERAGAAITLRFWIQPGGVSGHETILFIQDVTQSRESERARDNFLYHVTHEFRTPLTNIRAYAETLAQGMIDDEQTLRECYNVIMSETSRLSRLVEDLLSISQLEVGTAKLNIHEVVLNDLLRKVVQDHQGHADAKDIDLVLRLPAKPLRVMGDRDRLAVVFQNLVGNAIKYTPHGGRVEVRANLEGQRAEIAVADTGLGIAPADQERIFEKFYRVNDERVLGQPGTGLGLSIARETLRAHGGNITLTSTPGQGSTFTAVLPALATEESGRSLPAVAAVCEGRV